MSRYERLTEELSHWVKAEVLRKILEALARDLVEATLAETITVGRPQGIVGDRAYDSDPLDRQLAAQGIEPIAPHRKIASARQLRMVAYSGAIDAEGRSSDCSLG